MTMRMLMGTGLMAFGVLGTVAAGSGQVLFSDDFSEPEADGAPNLEIWGASPTNENPPSQSIRVTDTGAAEFFGESDPYLHIFADGESGSSMWLTANRKLSPPSSVVTVAFDFYHPGSSDNGPRLRLGDGESIWNNSRVRQDIQFGSSGGMSGISGVFQPERSHHLRIIYNNSHDDIENYHGAATLESDAYDVWIDGERVISNRRWNTGQNALPVGDDIASLTFGVFGDDANELLVRDLRVYAGAVPGADAEPVTEDDGPFRYYLSPDGDDGNNGRGPESPVLTLSRVHQLLQAANPNDDVEVLIAPGTYNGQTTVWSYTRPDYSITFKPRDPDAGMPVFEAGVPDGDGGMDYPGGTWFRLNHSSGEATNLVFEGLRIQNYQDAISLNGNRNNPLAYNSHNTIRECYFYRIGNISNPDLSPSTAVIRFVNSQDNVVENNDFVDVVNTTGGGLIHATYIAHLADRNRIHRNRFINHSGDPIRVRDFSNDNDIRDNYFILAGNTGAYSEWYCDQDIRDDCTKPEPECPSWENEFRNNLIVSGYNNQFLPVFRFHQSDSTTGCSPLFEDARRLYTSGNTRPDRPSAYELWKHRFFEPAERDESDIAGPGANPAGDGVANLVKYALGLDPRRSAPASMLPATEIDADNRLTLSYPVNPGAEGVEIVVEVSDDLQNWESGTDRLESPESFEHDGRRWERVRTVAPVSDSDRAFLRLRVEGDNE